MQKKSHGVKEARIVIHDLVVKGDGGVVGVVGVVGVAVGVVSVVGVAVGAAAVGATAATTFAAHFTRSFRV